MKGYVTILGTLALAAFGCQGDFQTNGGGGGVTPTAPDAGGPVADATENLPEPDEELTTAAALFEANVRPIIVASCSPGGACHSNPGQDPPFVAPITDSAEDAYATAMVYKDQLFQDFESVTAKLLLNGQGHQGATFSDDDVVAVQGWLASEKLAADADAPVYSALQIWSGCMNLDDWKEENVADLWANKGTNQGDCDACHNTGAEGFFASNDDDRVFKYVTEYPAFMPSYFTLDATGTNVLINRSRLENVGNLLEPHQAHPAFDVDGNAMEALQRFYDKTKIRMAAGGGQCDLPRY